MFPKGLRFFADIMPLGVGINVLKSISAGDCANIAGRLITLAVIAVLCTVISIKTFRWE